MTYLLIWSIAPVSYTHLDVYKRQAMQTRAVIKAALNVSAETGHVITPHIMIPVSYTHLDVYKRQGILYLEVIFRGTLHFQPLDARVHADAVALMHHIIAGLDVRKAGPVSYTHLDVYKRQAWI